MTDKYQYLRDGHWTATQQGTKPILDSADNQGSGLIMVILVILVPIVIFLFWTMSH
jgi:hypothetical protein